MIALAGQIGEAIHAGSRPRRYSHAADDDHAVDIAMEINGSAEQCSAWLNWLFIATRDRLSDPIVWRAVKALAEELLSHEALDGKAARCIVRTAMLGPVEPTQRP